MKYICQNFRNYSKDGVQKTITAKTIQSIFCFETKTFCAKIVKCNKVCLPNMRECGSQQNPLKAKVLNSASCLPKRNKKNKRIICFLPLWLFGKGSGQQQQMVNSVTPEGKFHSFSSTQSERATQRKRVSEKCALFNSPLNSKIN